MDKCRNNLVFLQHPDGSLSQGVPLGHQEQTPPATPRLSPLEPNQLLNGDVIRILARHETLFLSLLIVQLIVEILFETMHLMYWSDAVFELSLLYPSVSRTALHSVYFCASFAEVSYTAAYLSLGFLAAMKGKPRAYSRCSTVALFGTLAQLPLAYINRFNLLVFFLRFITYAYARFMGNLLRGLRLLRDDLPS